MASKLGRCILLWLMLFLCWFVLRSDPVAQESGLENEIFSTEKANLGFTEQEATPPLVSIQHTESIIPDNIDPHAFVTRPSIAPATPWDDTQIMSTVANENPKPLEESQIPEVETPSPVSVDNVKESQANDGLQATDVDNSGKVSEDDIKNLIKSLDPGENVEQDVPAKDTSVPQGDGDDGTIPTAKSEQKQVDDEIEKENEFPETAQFKTPEDGATSHDNHNANRLPLGKEGDEDLSGTHDGLEGTHEDTHDGLEGTPEDMPSFSEWSQKYIAQEEEKKVQQINEKGSLDLSTQLKKKTIDRKQNNYASVDCGANIPEMNSEAQNAHSILLENKDLYMLNPCSANIWFIVELCDHVHVTSLQLANFEMFSSTIEKFQVSFSTRYPTREWSQLQTFTAKLEKSIQTFTIDPIFAKYIKVEQLSHHGSEHYCPWSLLRVYGNSMVEEYEEHESPQNENTGVDEDQDTSSNTTEDKHIPQGILKSATDAVLNFVKETAKKLVNVEEQTNSTGNMTNNTKHPEDNSSKPLPQKTIVQLMPREEYEASCHGNGEDTPSCLPESGCASSEVTPYTSYKAFLDIVHNICSRNSRNAEMCFSNVSKMFAANTSNREQGQGTNANEVIIDSVGNEQTRNQDLGISETDLVESVKLGDAAKSVSLEEFHEQNLSQTPTSSSQIITSETSPVSESVLKQLETSSNSADEIIITSSSSIQTGTTHSSVVISSPAHDFDGSSSPTPLPQPPLAVNEDRSEDEPPTPQPDSLLEESHSEQTSSDTSQSVPSREDVPATSSSETISITTYPTSTTLRETLSTSSIVTEKLIQVPETVSVSLQEASTSTLATETLGQEGYEGSHGGNKEHEGSDRGDKEYEGSRGGNKENDESDGDNNVNEGTHRGNKEYEDIPNPHVDVLKITLTDAETKEGTAELEETSEEQHETVVQPTTDEGKFVDEEGKLDTASSSKEEGAQDTLEDSEVKQDKPELSEMDVLAPGQNIDNSKETGLLSEDRSQTDTSEEDSDNSIVDKASSASDEGQCEIKDSRNVKRTVETDASNMEHASTTQVEAVPTLTAGNGNANGKKESVFVTLSRKIKALEQNVTMTNLFLEELSQRYRKSMDEMQKKMEKKFSLFSKNSKLLTKVNLVQNSTILALTTRIEQLEEKLNEATSRLKVINQEVVERHVLGMCLQFVFVFILWFILRRVGGRAERCARHAVLGNGHLKNGSVTCNETDYRQQHGTAQEIVHGKKDLSEFHLSKPPLSPEAWSDSKRRKRRKNRPSSVASDHALHTATDQGQNIVSRTAGLLFHSPGSHDTLRHDTKDSRSCSADSLSNFPQDERNLVMKKSAFSPKSKRVLFQNKKESDDLKTRTVSTDVRLTTEPHHTQHTKLVRSKSSGECYQNRLALSDQALSTSSPHGSLGKSQCSLQSTSVPLKDGKSGWIWGLG